MEVMDIIVFNYIDLTTVSMDLFETLGSVFAGGFMLATLLQFAAYAVFGLIELLDIKEK